MRIDPYGRLAFLTDKKKREDELSKINAELERRNQSEEFKGFRIAPSVENLSLKRTEILKSEDGIVYLVEKEQKKL